MRRILTRLWRSRYGRVALVVGFLVLGVAILGQGVRIPADAMARYCRSDETRLMQQIPQCYRALRADIITTRDTLSGLCQNEDQEEDARNEIENGLSPSCRVIDSDEGSDAPKADSAIARLSSLVGALPAAMRPPSLFPTPITLNIPANTSQKISLEGADTGGPRSGVLQLIKGGPVSVRMELDLASGQRVSTLRRGAGDATAVPLALTPGQRSMLVIACEKTPCVVRLSK